MAVDYRQTHAKLIEALRKIGDKEAWAKKYPNGDYQCIAVECIGIARDVLREVNQQ
jgi:hypothetical protein